MTAGEKRPTADTRVVVSVLNLDLIDRLEALTPGDVLWRAVGVADEEGPVYLTAGDEPVAAIVSLDFVEAAPPIAFLPKQKAQN